MKVTAGDDVPVEEILAGIEGWVVALTRTYTADGAAIRTADYTAEDVEVVLVTPDGIVAYPWSEKDGAAIRTADPTLHPWESIYAIHIY